MCRRIPLFRSGPHFLPSQFLPAEYYDQPGETNIVECRARVNQEQAGDDEGPAFEAGQYAALTRRPYRVIKTTSPATVRPTPARKRAVIFSCLKITVLKASVNSGDAAMIGETRPTSPLPNAA